MSYGIKKFACGATKDYGYRKPTSYNYANDEEDSDQDQGVPTYNYANRSNTNRAKSASQFTSRSLNHQSAPAFNYDDDDDVDDDAGQDTPSAYKYNYSGGARRRNAPRAPNSNDSSSDSTTSGSDSDSASDSSEGADNYASGKTQKYGDKKPKRAFHQIDANSRPTGVVYKSTTPKGAASMAARRGESNINLWDKDIGRVYHYNGKVKYNSQGQAVPKTESLNWDYYYGQ